MQERELKEDEEMLVHDAGDTEFTNTGKEKKIKRIIILLIFLLIIAGIIIAIVLLLKKSDKSKPKPKNLENIDILKKDSDFVKPKSFSKNFELIQLKDSKYKIILVQDPKTVKAGVEIRTKFGYNTDVIDGFAHYAEHFFLDVQKKLLNSTFLI